jgi:hypothetical protein
MIVAIWLGTFRSSGDERFVFAFISLIRYPDAVASGK